MNAAELEQVRKVTPAADAARKRRLAAGWLDPEVSRQDLYERGFTTTEMVAIRRELGPKAQPERMPEFGQMRKVVPR